MFTKIASVTIEWVVPSSNPFDNEAMVRFLAEAEGITEQLIEDAYNNTSSPMMITFKTGEDE
jgi:hypothetical protein